MIDISMRFYNPSFPTLFNLTMPILMSTAAKQQSQLLAVIQATQHGMKNGLNFHSSKHDRHFPVHQLHWY